MRAYIKIIVKTVPIVKNRGSGVQETKTLSSAAAYAATDNRFMALLRVAGEPAVLAHAHRWERFFINAGII